MIGQKVILPIWHGIDREYITRFSPPLADTLAFNSAELSVEETANAFAELVNNQ